MMAYKCAYDVVQVRRRRGLCVLWQYRRPAWRIQPWRPAQRDSNGNAGVRHGASSPGGWPGATAMAMQAASPARHRPNLEDFPQDFDQTVYFRRSIVKVGGNPHEIVVSPLIPAQDNAGLSFQNPPQQTGIPSFYAK